MNTIAKLARPEILAMTAYQSARSTAAADGILLNANEAPRSLLDDPSLHGLNRYPMPQPDDLKTRLAEIYGVEPEQLLVTRGSDEGIDLLTRVFCRPARDAIVECPPCFGMYRISATIQGAEIIQVARKPSRELKIDFNRLCETTAEQDNARLVFLTSPNNPTGDVITEPEILRVLEACGEHALLVLDEAYIEFCDSRSATSLITQWPNLVVLRTLSKAWGAAGLRCGSVVANPEVIGLLQRVMAPYPLTAPAVEIAMSVTSATARQNQADMLAQLAASKSDLLAFLENCWWVKNIWPGAANFVLISVDDAPALTAYCADRGVRIRDFSSQAMLESCVRLTVGKKEEMAVLSNILKEYGDRK